MQTEIPVLGLGTYGRTGDEGREAILAGLEIGYRHIDTAQSYGTEEPVGAAVRASSLHRQDVFITTKIATSRLAQSETLPSLEESLGTMGVDSVDLALIHWRIPEDVAPFARYMEDLATAKERGLTRRIGVSNFTIEHLERAREIVGAGEIATNQVEIHPFLQNRKLVDYCLAAGITPTAYVPLAKGKVANDPVLARIGERHGASASQIALAWLLARGIIVIPASANSNRMRSNLEAKDIQLTEADMDEIATLERGERIIAPADGPDWD